MSILRNIFKNTAIVIFVFISNLTANDTNEDIRNSKKTAAIIENDFTSFHFNQSDDLSEKSIDDFIEIALLNNPELKSAFYTWKAELEKTGYTGILIDPILMYEYFIENIENGVAYKEQMLRLKQRFPWFGTLGNKKDIVFENSEAAYQKYQSLKTQIIFDVKTVYAELYLLNKEIQITKDNMELLKFWESIAQTKYKTGQTAHPDLIKVQLELGTLEEKLLTVQNKQYPVMAKFKELLNIPYTVTLSFPDSLRYSETTLNRDSIIELSLSNNPSLKRFQHQIIRSQKTVSLTKKEAYPEFSFDFDYVKMGEASNSTMLESDNDSWNLTFGLSLPLWFGKNKAKRNEAYARLKETEYMEDAYHNKIITYIENAVYEYENSLRQISLYRDGLIPKAEQALNVSFEAYRLGEISLISLLDSQRQLLNFYLKFEEAKTRLFKFEAQIKMLTAEEI